MSIQLEVGKVYVSRNGHEIVAISEENDDGYDGQYWATFKGNNGDTYSYNGRNSPFAETPFDLVKEVTNQKDELLFRL